MVKVHGLVDGPDSLGRGRARDPNVPTLFQVSDVDTEVIRWANGDWVQQVMLPFEIPADV